jgi:hypothetical protein
VPQHNRLSIFARSPLFARSRLFLFFTHLFAMAQDVIECQTIFHQQPNLDVH